MILDPLTILALAGVGMLAGFVDAIAGGGGLIAVPALIAAGLSPVAALATNKMQSIPGTSMAAITYWRRGFVRLRAILPAIAVTYAGGLAGVAVVKHVDTGLLTLAIPVALLLIAAYFLLAPRLDDTDGVARLPLLAGAALIGVVVGFYDGAFGPGTGSFMTLGFVALCGLGVTRAAGHTKTLNLTSNLAALTVFIPAGDVVWPVALVMGVGQFAGGYLGALTGIRFGARVIRPLVVVVSVALALRVLLTR